MPIRALDAYIKEKYLLNKEFVSSLAGTRLGIDANYWLRNLTRAKHEVRLAPLGATLPATLRRLIETDVAWMRAKGITPLVVFTGIKIPRDAPFKGEHARIDSRSAAWDMYAAGRHGSAGSNWAATGAPFYDMFPFVMHVLSELGVEFLRAPYSAWAQLAYLANHPAQPVHAVYAGTDVFMFGVDRVVTELDSANTTAGATFTWVDRAAVLASLGLSRSQFLDACILAGFDWIETYTPLVSDPNWQFTWPTLASLFQTLGLGLAIIQNIHDDASRFTYPDKFARVRCAVKHHLVLTTSGTIAPLEPASAPADLHEVFGPRPPAHAVRALVHGGVGPSLINSAAFAALYEMAPMCNGETPEFHAWVRRWAQSLVDAANAMVGAWDPRWAANTRSVALRPWFLVPPPPNPHPPQHVDVAPAFNLSPWSVGKAWIEKYVGGASEVSLAKCVLALAASDEAAAETVGSPVAEADQARDQLLALTIFKLLELRGFVDSTTHRLTPWGRVLATSLAPTDPAPLAESLLIQCELLRDNLLHGHAHSKTYAGTGPLAGAESSLDPTTRAHITLLTRAACALEPVPAIPAVAWDGPVDRNLLTHASFVKHAARALHDAADAMLVHSLFPSAAVKIGVAEFPQIAARVPFAGLPGAAGDKSATMGVVLREFLVGGDAELTRLAAFLADPKADVDRVRTLVDGKLVPLAANAASAGLVDPKVADAIRDAAAWWAKREGRAAPVPVVAVKEAARSGNSNGGRTRNGGSAGGRPRKASEHSSGANTNGGGHPVGAAAPWDEELTAAEIEAFAKREAAAAAAPVVVEKPTPQQQGQQGKDGGHGHGHGHGHKQGGGGSGGRGGRGGKGGKKHRK
ncbi:hypothetical protein H9P43_006493 [Blastocladiella emersonii ATCC 22665]|nr:hypothetical protein H9P43_006493 [Blastocladiella emersonii ATCC 22665]